jgi:hypothetical protein
LTNEHVLQVDGHESEDGQDSQVEEEHCENGKTNMSFRLTDMIGRMNKTHGLRERTVRIDMKTGTSIITTYSIGLTENIPP